MKASDAVIELTEYLGKLNEEYEKFGLLETERRIKAVKLAIKCLQETFRK